jgi:hypothetical protein
MATAPEKLDDYINLLDRTFGLDRGGIEQAINGDYYLEFDVTTDSSLENRLERTIVNALNRAVDPNAYGINTGPTQGENTSTYTVIWDESNGDFDLISGDYDTYRNDLAGISDGDVPFARPGYDTNIFLDGKAYRIAAPAAEVLGTSMEDWTENWWTWVLQAPADTNPQLDETGEWADVDNDGPVYFVAGAFGGTWERTFTVEAGKPLLLPVSNLLYLGTAELSEEASMIEADASFDAWEQSDANLSATIDGVPVENLSAYLVRSDFFTPGNPEPQSFLDETLGIPQSDDLYPSASTGYWLMIEGLTPGEHTIAFSGTVAGNSVSVTDHVFIV